MDVAEIWGCGMRRGDGECGDVRDHAGDHVRLCGECGSRLVGCGWMWVDVRDPNSTSLLRLSPRGFYLAPVAVLRVSQIDLR